MQADDDIPEAVAVPPRRARFSPIWIVPILAIVVAIGIAWDRLASEGPTITIIFKSADGIEAGKTFVKYKEVNIGQVTAVRLTDDTQNVEVTARIAKSASPLMVEDAHFWVFGRASACPASPACRRSSRATTSVSRRERPTKKGRQYIGLEVPPIVTGKHAGPPVRAPVEGSRVRSGSGRPCITAGFRSGQVVAYDLAPDGAPCRSACSSARPTTSTSCATRGSTMRAASTSRSPPTVSTCARNRSSRCSRAASPSRRRPATRARRRRPRRPCSPLFHDRVTAMKIDESIATRYVLYFQESVRGLSTGAPVNFYGVAVGEVTEVGLFFDPKTLNVKPRVEVVLYPERVVAQLPTVQGVRLQAMVEQQVTRRDFMQKLVEQRGLRAQLATGSLLTGQRFVSLAYFPKASRRDSTGRRRLPSCRRRSARFRRSRRSSAASSTSSRRCRSTASRTTCGRRLRASTKRCAKRARRSSASTPT
jgi:paraquat-inducible protein B